MIYGPSYETFVFSEQRYHDNPVQAFLGPLRVTRAVQAWHPVPVSRVLRCPRGPREGHLMVKRKADGERQLRDVLNATAQRTFKFRFSIDLHK